MNFHQVSTKTIEELFFSSGMLPQYLKMARVIPIFKGNDSKTLPNYKLITIPQSFSKLCEYAFVYRLLPFLDKFNILEEQQHGFRSDRSTNTATLLFINKLMKMLMQRECTAAVFCDFSRAFDYVCY